MTKYKFHLHDSHQEFVRAALRKSKDQLGQVFRAGLKSVKEMLICVQLLPTLPLQRFQTAWQCGRVSASSWKKKLDPNCDKIVSVVFNRGVLWVT